MSDIESIRKAVLKNHGGFKEASDAQIMTIWDSLDETTKQRYLKKVTTKAERKAKDASGS
jgi:hypothetical protein